MQIDIRTWHLLFVVNVRTRRELASWIIAYMFWRWSSRWAWIIFAAYISFVLRPSMFLTNLSPMFRHTCYSRTLLLTSQEFKPSEERLLANQIATDVRFLKNEMKVLLDEFECPTPQEPPTLQKQTQSPAPDRSQKDARRFNNYLNISLSGLSI